jgi:catechol 2,3-dioxygenase-like lactoylglutathione lyase family enzyme
MEPRVSLITLGVSDLQKAVRFYQEVVGWKAAESPPGIAFFDLGGIVFSLYPHSEMVKEWDQVLNHIPDYRGFALAHNVGSSEEVDEIFASLRETGATIVKTPQKAFWGGYSGYFADLDGNKWEVAYNPFWTVGADGRISMSTQ